MGNLKATASIAANLLRTVALIAPCLAAGFGAASAVACTTKVIVVTPTPTNEPSTPTVTPRPTAMATLAQEPMSIDKYLAWVRGHGAIVVAAEHDLRDRFQNENPTNAAWTRTVRQDIDTIRGQYLETLGVIPPVEFASAQKLLVAEMREVNQGIEAVEAYLDDGRDTHRSEARSHFDEAVSIEAQVVSELLQAASKLGLDPSEVSQP